MFRKLISFLTCLSAVYKVQALPWTLMEKRAAANNPRPPLVDLGAFPSPCVFYENGVYYAFSTTFGSKIPIATARSFDGPWTRLQGRDALSDNLSWSDGSAGYWAPDVAKVGDHYVLYYSGKPPGADKRCVGAAVASSILGPYTETAAPVICTDDDSAGYIDPNFFRDPHDGKTWLVHKSNEGGFTHIALAPLSANGTRLTARDPYILQRARAGDYLDTEGPCLTWSPAIARYVLFFNTGYFQNETYTTRVALASELRTNDWYRQPVPVMTSGSNNVGYAPGGVDVLPVDHTKIVMYAYDPNQHPGDGAHKYMHTARIKYRNGRVSLA